ncbi:unnamed protein product [Strongylus vulgaris]|uniref:Uncharacterized protein n=1 Tax=Strongylus vulgaris TaxID=40348 RepID=A0A3P7ISD1_STRVU|nr:unnamed protein product [Strongylus vulgaris]
MKTRRFDPTEGNAPHSEEPMKPEKREETSATDVTSEPGNDYEKTTKQMDSKMVEVPTSSTSLMKTTEAAITTTLAMTTILEKSRESSTIEKTSRTASQKVTTTRIIQEHTTPPAIYQETIKSTAAQENAATGTTKKETGRRTTTEKEARRTQITQKEVKITTLPPIITTSFYSTITTNTAFIPIPSQVPKTESVVERRTTRGHESKTIKHSTPDSNSTEEQEATKGEG